MAKPRSTPQPGQADGLAVHVVTQADEVTAFVISTTQQPEFAMGIPRLHTSGKKFQAAASRVLKTQPMNGTVFDHCLLRQRREGDNLEDVMEFVFRQGGRRKAIQLNREEMENLRQQASAEAVGQPPSAAGKQRKRPTG